MKPGLELSKVVLLGRTFPEYLRYFKMDEEELRAIVWRPDPADTIPVSLRSSTNKAGLAQPDGNGEN